MNDRRLARAEYIATTVRLDMFVAHKEAERTMEGLQDAARDLAALRGELSAAAVVAAEAVQLPLFA